MLVAALEATAPPAAALEAATAVLALAEFALVGAMEDCIRARGLLRRYPAAPDVVAYAKGILADSAASSHGARSRNRRVGSHSRSPGRRARDDSPGGGAAQGAWAPPREASPPESESGSASATKSKPAGASPIAAPEHGADGTSSGTLRCAISRGRVKPGTLEHLHGRRLPADRVGPRLDVLLGGEVVRRPGALSMNGDGPPFSSGRGSWRRPCWSCSAAAGRRRLGAAPR